MIEVEHVCLWVVIIVLSWDLFLRNLSPPLSGKNQFFSFLVREVIMVWGGEGLEQGGLGPQIPSVKLQIEAPPVR